MSAPSYTDATSELDQILRELENGRLNVDDVVAKVQRAKELLDHCRDRVRAATMKVHEILEEQTPAA